MQFLFRIITGFFSFVLTLTSLFVPVGKDLPAVPDDFTPVIRFTVCSDIHLNGEEDQASALKFAGLFEDAYAYAESSSYNKLDAVLVAGDMTNGGRDFEYERFMKIKNDNIKEGTEFITCMGNHEFIEYRDYDPTIGYDMYQKYVNEDVDTHYVINGYHIIAVSYADDAKTFKGKEKWLRAELDKACADTPDKPVFVIQHPHPFGTIYGSVTWGDLTIKNILVNYPQVIDFSGHSHYAANDPRCMYQNNFTAVGTGSLSALMVNLGYIEGDEDAPFESGCFWIVEADAQGNVRLHLYDEANHMFFPETDYYLPDVSKKANHFYNWNNLKTMDSAPAFPEGAALTAERNNDGDVILSFPVAENRWGTESYQISLKGAESKSFTVISNYVTANAETMQANAGALAAGDYTFTIKPVSPYANIGKALKGSFTVA